MISLETAKESSISVAVRVRPFTPTEENKLLPVAVGPIFTSDGALLGGNDEKPPLVSQPRGIRKIVNVVDDRMLIFDPPDTNPLSTMQRNAFPNGNRARIRDYRFAFDRLFDELASQADVYENTTRPLLDSILDGFNATVFAYGATGCGKTHTILGSPQDPGVIFLTMKELYERIDSLSDSKLFDVSISFLEIYNETIRDLLNPETPFKKLILREDSNKRITVSNLLSRTPSSVDEVMDLLVTGNDNRTCSPTEANAASSRSHAVLQINVILRNRTASLNEEHTVATLSIIDLAGSERAAATKNRGARLNEGANINKSLLALGNCINALCDPRRKNHIPYRDLKLTRLLKFSLGGNCKTVMIVCISPLSQHYDETLNTLKYANRAKEIKTKLIRNRHNLDRHVGSYLKMITEQKTEIEELRAREAKVVETTIAKHNTILNRCLQETLTSINSLTTTLAKQHHEKWRKYFLLAKRKLLLLQQNDLSILVHYLRDVAKHDNHLMVRSVKQLVVHAEQLRNKASEQIATLERQYDTPSEIDHILSRFNEFTLKKLKELDGWNENNTRIFENMVDAVKTQFQNDLLVNSSVLFDYLIGELNSFNYLPQGFSSLVLSFITNKDATVEITQVVVQVTEILEKMNNSDYDSAIEEATTHFIQSRLRQEDEPRNIMQTRVNLEHKGGDKRAASTSPQRSSPPRNHKRSIKGPVDTSSPGRKNGWEGNFFDGDISIDDSTMIPKSDLDDDSPITNHILDRSLIDSLDFNPILNSPPMSKRRPEKVRRLLTETKLIVGDAQLVADKTKGQPSRLPLLNKLASTKIVQNEDIDASEAGTLLQS